MAAHHAFLFADLAGYTALTEAHGDEDAASTAQRLEELTTLALAGSARVVKTLGDAVMVVASTAGDAAATALHLARLVAREPLFPALRAGLHCGPAVERSDDYFGAAVNLASRLADGARPGEILCTRVVADHLAGSETRVARVGELRLKNLLEPVEVFRLEEEGGPIEAVVDPVCRMQVRPEDAAATLVEDGCTYYFCSHECARTFAEHRGRSEE